MPLAYISPLALSAAIHRRLVFAWSSGCAQASRNIDRPDTDRYL